MNVQDVTLPTQPEIFSNANKMSNREDSRDSMFECTNCDKKGLMKNRARHYKEVHKRDDYKPKSKCTKDKLAEVQCVICQETLTKNRMYYHMKKNHSTKI